MAGDPMLRQDFIKRVIEELGRAVSRLAGLKTQDPQHALQEIETLKAKLPVVPGLLESGPATTIARALADPELVRLVAELYRVESEQHKALGNTAAAVRCMQRSLALFRVEEVASHGPTAGPIPESDRPDE
jgi:hypothetical protein